MMMPGGFNPSQTAIAQALAAEEAKRAAEKAAKGDFFSKLGPISSMVQGLGGLAMLVPGLQVPGAAAAGAGTVGSMASTMGGMFSAPDTKMTASQMYNPPAQTQLPAMSRSPSSGPNFGLDPQAYRQALMRLRF